MHSHVLPPGSTHPCGSSSCWDLQQTARAPRTKLQYEAEALDAGLSFDLDEDEVGLFPWREGWRWDMGKPGGELFFDFASQMNHLVWVREMLFSRSRGRT